MVEDEIYNEVFGGLTSDVVFKKFFRDKTDIVSKLLSEILNVDIKEDDITYINIEHVGDKDEKKSLLDLEVKLPSGEYIIIEMQNGYGDSFNKRVQYYTSKIIATQLLKGTDYNKLKKVYSISFLSGKDSSEKYMYPKLFTTEVLCDKISKEEKPALFVYHYINLEMLKNNEYGFSEFALAFFELMNIKKKEGLYNMETNDEFIKRSIDYIRKINNDPVIKYTLDKELKDELDYNTDMLEAREYGQRIGYKEGLAKGIEDGVAKGIEQGIEQGINERQNEIIKNMINNNLDINMISDVTGLTISEINEISNNN